MPARLSALGALLFLLPWGFGLIPGVANADCKLATVADFHADKSGGAPIIDGTVNGQPIKIVVDAGSSKTLFTSAAAKRLGLITTRLTGGTFAIGGDDRASMTAVKELTIDRLKLSNITLGVVVGPDRPRGFDMLLGDDLLSHYDVEFDLANSAVRLFEAQGCQPPQECHLAADLVELLAQGIRRADDDCLERLHGLCPGLDRGVASDLEMTIISTVPVPDFGCPTAWPESTARAALSASTASLLPC